VPALIKHSNQEIGFILSQRTEQIEYLKKTEQIEHPSRNQITYTDPNYYTAELHSFIKHVTLPSCILLLNM
jgi:hypothetical protein